MTVSIFVEGGGKGKDLPGQCRRAFRTLLENAGIKASFTVTACGGRGDACRDFRKALRIAGSKPLLLVDSEGPVTTHRAWDHLGNRPAGVRDEQAQLMVQCMETWLVADRASLRAVFGAGVQEDKLPQHANLEAVHKDEMLAKLKAATSHKYSKGQHSFKLLGGLDPTELKKLPRAVQFFEAVEQLGR